MRVRVVGRNGVDWLVTRLFDSMPSRWMTYSVKAYGWRHARE